MLPQVYSHEHSKHDNLDEWNCRFWGVCCESGKKYSQVVSRRFKLTMAALDPESYQGGSPYVSVVLERDGAEYLLCSLKHEHILQVNLNLVFESGQNVTFSLKGDGIVHLSGYQDGNCVKLSVTDKKGNAENNTSTLGKTMKNGRIYCEICDTFIKSETIWEEHIRKKKHKRNTEEVMKARFLSSNPIIEVKTPSIKIENPIIDLDEEPAVGKKGKSSSSFKSDVRNLPSTSKAKDSEEDSSEIEELPPNVPSSSGKVGTSGFKVESSLETLLSKSLVKTLNEITDDEDDEEDEDFNILDAEEESDYDEDDSGDCEDDDSSDNSDDIINKTLEAQKRKRESEASANRKRMKNNSLSEASTSEASQKPIQVFDVDDKESSSSEEESDSSMDASSSFKKSPLLKKDKMFNKKKKFNDGVNQPDSSSVSNLSSSKANDTVHVQDVRPGYGPPAKSGKMVQVYYVGKFTDGKIFDQTENGKPFSFKLGAGQVIKGWDTGLEGMKVGGKRILRIPPNMGYGNQATEDIPANSTLVFHVELKSIS